MSLVINILDWVLFVLAAVPVVYFLIFAFASKTLYTPPSFKKAEKSGRFIILIPAYNCGELVLPTVKSALDQDYPRDCYRVVVVSEGLSPEQNEKILSLGAEVIEVSFEHSSKAKALIAAIDVLGSDAADYVSVLDADNLVERGYLSALNDAFASGLTALQAHRSARNRNTPTAVLDAASEEINNSIYRQGHNSLVMSSALIGSGMAFKYGWFAENIRLCNTAGEDKELELLLLSQGIRVHYLPDVVVLDEKTTKLSSYHKQRRRWISAQYYSFAAAFKWLIPALKNRNVEYLDKMLQWSFIPRMLMVLIIVAMSVACPFISLLAAMRWWILLLLLLLSILMAMPYSQLDAAFFRSLLALPALCVSALANLFKLKGNKDKFIATEHTQQD